MYNFAEKELQLVKNYQEDKYLLSAIQKRDKNAFSTLFRRYYPMLCAYCHRFVDIEDAEEIVQDIFLWLWENTNTEIIHTSLSQYLFKAVYHRAINKIKKNEIRHRADTFFFKEMQEMLEDTDFYIIEELNKQIKTAISNLPSSYREAFTMHRFQNMSYKQISQVLNVSPKTIDYRIQQALKLLRIALKDYLPLIYFLIINLFRKLLLLKN